ncbi:Iron-sulfur cluster assembly protein 1 [Zea mays]|uniref:Iron-sulfur cluster assembly protein 1 n=1 Tax=Zea mays TaxID=4577 RepID=A0A1D6G0W5_MAIZE|nr:Iron-sulfur cluster assembly protein 1 [Zea mays]
MLRAGARQLLAPGLRRLGLGTGAAGQVGPAAAAAGMRAYHERVVDHYNNPRNVGSFDKEDPNVGTGLVGAPACGDVMKLQIRVDEDSGKIVDACFKTFGCGSAIASSSVGMWQAALSATLASYSSGVHAAGCSAIKYHADNARELWQCEIAKHLSLPPVKLHCSMLAEDAIKAAVKDYEAKKAKMGQKSEDSPSEKAAEA